MWSGAAHWSAILASFVGLGFLGPLIVLLTQGTKSPRVVKNRKTTLMMPFMVMKATPTFSRSALRISQFS